MRLPFRAAVFAFLALLLLSAANPAPAAADDSFYSLHVSSYRRASEAASAVDRLRELNLDAFSLPWSVAGQGRWHRVLIGRFQRRSEAEAFAGALKQRRLLSDHSQYNIVAVPAEQAGRAVTLNQTENDVSAFRESIEGSWVGSYRHRREAERQAEGLTLRGWPAYILTRRNKGKVWHRVYLWPSDQDPPKGGFDLVVDLSYTAPGAAARLGLETYRCLDMTKFEAVIALIDRINAAAPSDRLWAALREVGYAEASSSENVTRRVWGVAPHDAAGYGRAVANLKPSPTSGPLGWAVSAADADLYPIPLEKDLILISDFRKNRDLGRPLVPARQLVDKYGRDLCIHTIYFDADDQAVRLARDVAQVSRCGNVFDGCLALGDPAYFNKMIRIVFGDERMECLDADQDGVCDHADQCPGTPLGAVVDSRGCWIAAFAAYFDFDKSVVKKQYLPNIKQAADILKANPARDVVLEGHTDSVGTNEYNLGLGRRRAKAVKAKLAGFGVAPGRLKVKSYGESRPVAPNDTAAGRAKNRRVEIRDMPLAPIQ